MPQTITTIDGIVRGITAGALLCVALSVWRGTAARQARAATVLASVSIALWVVGNARGLAGSGALETTMDVLGAPVAGFFWLLVAVVFEERPITPVTLAPALALLVSDTLRTRLPDPAADFLYRGEAVFDCAVLGHAAVMIAAGWRNDLLRGRRRARALLFGAGAAVGLFDAIISMGGVHFGQAGGLASAAADSLEAAAMAAIGIAGASLFLEARPGMMEPARRPAPHDAAADHRDGALLDRLQACMDGGIWRREGLSIGALAGELGMPEHRLRSLINDRLGYRNFADFLNARRIEAAKARLADPAEARSTVAAIAFDLGYGSLGPFNRAFRAATGATPTAWRRAALGAANPDLEISG